MIQVLRVNRRVNRSGRNACYMHQGCVSARTRPILKEPTSSLTSSDRRRAVQGFLKLNRGLSASRAISPVSWRRLRSLDTDLASKSSHPPARAVPTVAGKLVNYSEAGSKIIGGRRIYWKQPGIRSTNKIVLRSPRTAAGSCPMQPMRLGPQ